ncbi:hypothetical protein L2E82_43080 [Cichorium intybus]|uniref:Uncharacterized protein n=1 Tax=Cichorium intybus TaxID=13427 RepID=A0ACB8ZSH9_CICIN|nr:hypothetical protein L2E82_43080 [Cichorium intybus]
MSAHGVAADSSSTRPSSTLLPAGNGNASRSGPLPSNSNCRLRLNANWDHKPENYEDLQSEFSPLRFSSMERYLPPNLLNTPRETKFGSLILLGFRKHTNALKDWSTFKPLYRELYQLNARTFFVPSFLNAFMPNANDRKESIKNIMSEPVPGVYTFDMLQPHFCEMMLAEVENLEKWTQETKISTMRPNTMNKYGIVLDDFVLVYPILVRHVFFADVGGFALDSHHGFVVEYGFGRDVELGSAFREMRKHMKKWASWCGECQREKRERLHQAVAVKKELLGAMVMEKLWLD